MNEITDTDRLNRIFAEPEDNRHIVMQINRYGKGAIGNPMVSALDRGDIDAVLINEAEADTIADGDRVRVPGFKGLHGVKVPAVKDGPNYPRVYVHGLGWTDRKTILTWDIVRKKP
jgi:hypothetical protein